MWLGDTKRDGLSPHDAVLTDSLLLSLGAEIKNSWECDGDACNVTNLSVSIRDSDVVARVKIGIRVRVQRWIPVARPETRNMSPHLASSSLTKKTKKSVSSHKGQSSDDTDQ